MKKISTILVCLFILFAIQTKSYCQNQFIYTNNNNFETTNAVSAFMINVDGTLSEITGSPFSTNGTGGGWYFGSNRINAVRATNFLYVANEGSDDISAFAINPTTGFLTLVPGSPFSTGGSSGYGVSIAVSPNGSYLFAGNDGTNDVSVFTIASNGSLTPISGSPFATGSSGGVDGMVISPNGKHLAVCSYLTNNLIMLEVSNDGSLNQATGSPYTLNTGTNAIFNSTSDVLFVGTIIHGISVYTVASNGVITNITSSPFTTSSNDNQTFAISSDDQYLYTSNIESGTIDSYNIASGGALTAVTGTPFAVPSSSQFTVGLAVNDANSLLYVAGRPNNQINGFNITNGELSPINGFPIYLSSTNSMMQTLVYFKGGGGIHTNALASNNLCLGNTYNVSFTASGTFNPGNIFTAQLSDASGSFASPVSIGTLASTTSGTISVTIPVGTTLGSQYRIRVVSSDYAVIGSNNGSDITINQLPTPTISGPTNICNHTTGNVYTTESSMGSYTWNVTGGTITAGAGTNSITVTWNTEGAQTVSVNYANTNGCTAATATVYGVTVKSAPNPVITGSPDNLYIVPKLATYQYSTPLVAGDLYSWSSPKIEGYCSATARNCINVHFLDPCCVYGQWTISVTETNPGTGCSTKATKLIYITP